MTHKPQAAPAQTSLHNKETSQDKYDGIHLFERAVHGLSDALNVLQTSPLTNADLQHAIGRGMRGVTAIKRMMALGYATAHRPTYSEEALAGDLCPASPLGRVRRRRRSFDDEYKRQVVALVRQREGSIKSVCEELNLTYSAVKRWTRQFKVECYPDKSVAPPPAEATDTAERLRMVEELLERLQADSELVKARLGLSFPKKR